MQVADVKKVLMSTHKMNQTGLRVVLDGEGSYFVEKSTGKSTPIKYEGGKYYFDIWAPADTNKRSIKTKSEDDMETDHISKIKNSGSRFWVLGTEDEISPF